MTWRVYFLITVYSFACLSMRASWAQQDSGSDSIRTPPKPCCASRSVPESTPKLRTPLPLLAEDGRDLGLYRRLVNIPGSDLLNNPGGSSVSHQPKAFSTFYIFSEKTLVGKRYYEVGPPGKQPTGWFKSSDIMEWPNNVTLTPTTPALRVRAPFLRSHPAILNRTQNSAEFAKFAQEVANTMEYLEKAQRNGDSSAITVAEKKIADYRNLGVVAVESANHRNWRDNFFLMPVLDFAESDKSPVTGKSEHTFFRTAVVPSRLSGEKRECKAPGKIGVVFVIDTTKSMQQYIDKTQKVVEELVGKVIKEVDPERVRFGLVGFRDDPVERPLTEYRAKVFQYLAEDKNPSSMAGLLDQINATEHSTKDFSEDGLYGVLKAVDMNWDEFQSRWIVLITDASPREETVDDRGKTTNVGDAASLLWDVNSTGLVAIHLQTKEAQIAGDVSIARTRLKALAKWDNVDTPYYEIADGDLDTFGTEIGSIVEKILGHANKSFSELKTDAGLEDPLARIGRAQRAIWLGKCELEFPRVIEGWITDKAQFEGGDPEKIKKLSKREPFSVQPRVLLTRTQLDLFRSAMQAVLDTYATVPEAGGDKFFDAVSDSLLNIMTDPSTLRTGDGSVSRYVVTRDADTLGELLPAFLELLPVKPDFFTMTRDGWENSTAVERDNFVIGVRRRVSNLEALLNNPKVWVPLHDDSSEYEYVTPVLINLLP